MFYRAFYCSCCIRAYETDDDDDGDSRAPHGRELPPDRQTDRRHAALEIDLFLLGVYFCATLRCRILVFIVVYTMRDVMSSEALCYYCAGAIASGHLHSPSYLFESSMLSIAVRSKALACGKYCSILLIHSIKLEEHSTGVFLFVC